jgi:lipopolysaccharide biosynthesis regulator YciM
MKSDRLKMLEKFMAEEPEDPFNIYALALEYLNSDSTQSGKLFDLLLDKHPDYVPTYYQAGNFFWDRGESDKALSVLAVGVEKAKKTGDVKAKMEIQSLLEQLS